MNGSRITRRNTRKRSRRNAPPSARRPPRCVLPLERWACPRRSRTAVWSRSRPTTRRRRPRLPIRRRKPLRIPLKPSPPRASMLPCRSITLRNPPKAPPSPQRLRLPSPPRLPLIAQPKMISLPRTTGAPSPACASPRDTALSSSRANGCSWRTRTPRPCARRSSATASRCSWVCTATTCTMRRS